MTMTPEKKRTAADLASTGTSVWLDDLSRQLVSNGLSDLVRDAGVVGVTSNPTIFATALTSELYDEQLSDLRARGVGLDEAVRLITTADVRGACDVLAPVFISSGGLDGFVSLEVDPRLAHDEEATVAEARSLHWLVDRENLMVKVPATDEGVRAFEQLTAEGISVNVTLVFSLARYRDVVEAYMSGLERAGRSGEDIARIASVASFFISRVDTAVNAELKELDHEELVNQAAVANAELAYAHHLKVLRSERWMALEAAGARPQRPLWASTGVKDERLARSHYVEALAGPGVVNTMPRATLDALSEAGDVHDRLSTSLEEAEGVLEALKGAGVDLERVTTDLEREGVEKFEASWEELLASVKAKL
jgi:transaldolase